MGPFPGEAHDNTRGRRARNGCPPPSSEPSTGMPKGRGAHARHMQCLCSVRWIPLRGRECGRSALNLPLCAHSSNSSWRADRRSCSGGRQTADDAPNMGAVRSRNARAIAGAFGAAPWRSAKIGEKRKCM
eukprot:5848942-Pyramimonas_sp.AAC.1